MGIKHGFDRIGCPIADIDTPVLLVDFDALERNIQRMAEFGASNGVGIRPHAKAHKTPIIAHMQLVAGGVRDILISNEVVGSAKLKRLTALVRLARITVAVDARAGAEALSTAATATDTTVGVVVDVDVGQGRCGVAPGQPALDLAAAVLTMSGLSLCGLLGYQGALQHVPGHQARARAAHEVQRPVGGNQGAVREERVPP